MDGALTAITLLSLATTGAVLYYAARLLREDRERSEARVAALADEIQRGGIPRTAAPVESEPLFRVHRPGPDARVHVDHVAPEEGHVRLVPLPGYEHADDGEAQREQGRSWPPVPRRGSDHASEEGSASGAVEDDDVAARTDAGVPAGTWFDRGEDDDRTPSRPWLIPVVGALVVGLVLAVLFLSSGSNDASRPAVQASAAPLELLSLRHTRGADTMTVSGLVRNPRTATSRAGITAVVFLFGKDGTFAASGRAPLDYQSLAPGDESPFVVSIPVTGPVTRYRVSFRTDAAVVPHVDGRDGVRVAEKK